jgi:hypothetical protein
VHLAAEPGHREPGTVRVGTWAVMCGRLVAVAVWDRQEPEGWPEKIRATVGDRGGAPPGRAVSARTRRPCRGRAVPG